MIDILIPVLGRPQNAAPLVENIRAVTEVEHTITFLSSAGDNPQIKEVAELASASVMEPNPIQQWIVPWQPAAADYAKKINAGFQATESEWVFMCADDVRFEPRWDTLALKEAGDRYHVIATNDLANAHVKRGKFGTHCLIRRRYVTEWGATGDSTPGLVLHEGYDHNFVDRELCHVAQHRDVYAFARESHVKHLHPHWKTAPTDATYAKGEANFRKDHELFLERARLWERVGLSDLERRMAV